MDFKLTVDRNINTPIYRQIIEQITMMVKNGTLKAGDRLPPERELAGIISIARGTINKAYEELERNNIIEVIQGRGSFVSKKQDILEEGRKEKAIGLIDEMLSSLVNLNFSYREISTFINIKLAEHEKKIKKVRIATVDCNPESLSIFKKQLSYISHVEISRFILDDVSKYKDPGNVFKEFDIILTTSTHYSELYGILPGIKDRILQAAVSPSRQTIIDIATIPDNVSIGIICSTKSFLEKIRHTLKAFKIDARQISYMLEMENIEHVDIIKFIETKNILVIPPDFQFDKEEYINAVQRFGERGGKIIKFEYQIERGSMMYIEEQISNILAGK